MNRQMLVLGLALGLPLAGLGASIAVHEARAIGASTWRIPVDGYDPRDPIRGHYITFRYAWRIAGAPHLCRTSTCTLCLEAGGQQVRVLASGARCPARIDLAASNLQPTFAPPAGDSQPLALSSRLWVSERRAPLLTRQLRQQRMVVVARLTRGGRLINERLEPATAADLHRR